MFGVLAGSYISRDAKQGMHVWSARWQLSHEMPSRACMFGVLAGSYLTIAKQGNACLHGAVSVSEVLFPAYLFGSFRS